MSKKTPTEKEIQDLAKKIDKITTKAQKQIAKADEASVSSASDSAAVAQQKQQLRQMMESMALLERAGMVQPGVKKDMANHEFWNTQPVPQMSKYKDILGKRGKVITSFFFIDEEVTEVGAIEANTPHDDIRKEPLPLDKNFEWCEIDMEDEAEVNILQYKGGITDLDKEILKSFCFFFLCVKRSRSFINF
jgi:glycylpeptide N-tetradecanoyltransferase